jgi:hypothetical protein
MRFRKAAPQTRILRIWGCPFTEEVNLYHIVQSVRRGNPSGGD